ncbi:MAG: hypothetical protein KAT62_01530 [Desulfuromonadales bacterium]|nr:hypothetical protein [Desulfuromonadales bacterium]
MLRMFKDEIAIVSLIVLLSIFRDVFSGEIVYSDRLLAWGFQTFFFGTFILYCFENRSASLFNQLYWTSFLAALLSVALLLSPTFDKYYESIQIDEYYEIYKNFEVRYRAYGIAENLNFTYAFVMGLFSGYSFLLLKKNILFLIPMFVFLITVVFNARIGLVPIVFFVIYALFTGKYLKSFFVIAVCLLSVLLTFKISQLLGFDLNGSILFSNMDWVLRFFSDIYNYIFFSNEIGKSSTMGTIFGDFLIFPDTVQQLFFGRGESLVLKEGMNSDVGFILQLNYAGVFYLLTILFFIFFTTFRLVRIVGIGHWFVIFYFVLLIILNTKGFVFAATPGGRLLPLLYMYFISTALTTKPRFQHVIL